MRKTVLLLVALVGLSASCAFADEIQVRQTRLEEAVHALSYHSESLATPQAVAPAAADMLAAKDATAVNVAIKRPYVIEKLSAPLALSEKMAAYTKWGNGVRIHT